jgi:hypothetical protein
MSKRMDGHVIFNSLGDPTLVHMYAAAFLLIHGVCHELIA